jgi:site-specific recombinase XerD
MQKKSLVDLLHDVEQEMLRLGYTEGSMKFYCKRWQMLLRFAQEQNEIFYSEALGIAFVEKYFNIFEKDLNRTLSHADIRELRIIRMIGDFQLHQTILRTYCKRQEILTDQYFISINCRFKSYCISKNYSKATTDRHVNLSARFMAYLVSQSITDCKAICLILIHTYIKTLAGYSCNTIRQHICSIRTFCYFLLEAEEIKTNFAEKIQTMQSRKQAQIPSVWTKEELKKLIEAIDRGNPRGKRDYAIILLACCLGMRCVDIKNLKMENFHWEENKLIFIQSKTKAPVSLPLIPEIGWAVINYFKYGRPKIDTPYIFVRHKIPFGPFVEQNGLASMIKGYIKLAHIPSLKKRRGMHSLRHTMASMLLEKDTPLHIISNILGHADVDSTAVYLKVGMEKLKECALAFEEVANHE